MLKALAALVVAVLLAALALELAALAGAWSLHRDGHFGAEIRWLERFQPLLPWDRGVEPQLEKLYRDRVERALLGGRLNDAVVAMQAVRARIAAQGRKPDQRLMALGIETYTRVADYVERRGQLSRAADWDDTLFVFAIRAEQTNYRYAALAAFIESLDLRKRDGQPCAALARVEWAVRGLGGDIPGFQRSVEQDLRLQCDQQRRARSRSRSRR